MMNADARRWLPLWGGILTLLCGIARGQVMEWGSPCIGVRDSAAMAYDPQRGCSVLFGGQFSGTSTENPSGTWGWNGSRWVRLATAGPARRWRHCMAYDSRRGVIVLFGGEALDSNYALLGDTWEWDGSAWSLRATSGPSARSGAAMAFDSQRGVTVLFGGSNSAETWEWDGINWSLRAATGPTGRTSAAMAFDSRRGVSVLYGGQPSSSETWEWDGQAWNRYVTSGPPAASGGCMAYDSQRGVVVLFVSAGLVWEWNGSVWVSHSSAAITPINGCADYDSQRGVAVVFGVNSDAVVGEWNGTTGNHIYSGQPGSVSSLGLASDSRRGVSVMFGGLSARTWEWTSVGWSLRSETGPPARLGPEMAYDERRACTVMYGGHGLSDLWEWDGDHWSQRNAQEPGGRDGHSMAYDSRRSVTVLFGGYSNGTYRNDTWEWDGTAWALRATPVAPPGRSQSVMAYDSRRGLTVLFGGSSPMGLLGDTWEWDGEAWTLRTSLGPPPRSESAMAYDSDRGVCVLCAGYGVNSILSDTWEWDGNVWMLRPLVGPPPRYQHAMAYDAQRGVTVLYGYGYGTWELRSGCSSPAITAPPASQVQCHSAGATFLVGASGDLPLGYQWQIQTAPGAWANLGLRPVQLPCGGSALAFTPYGAQTEVRVSTCPGITSYQVRCLVSNACGIVASPPAEDLVCYANCDCSSAAPALNVSDFLCFMSSFAAGEPYANCDGSTSPPVLSVNDFVCFQSRFIAGCP